MVLNAGRIDCALRDRVFSFDQRSDRRVWRAVLMTAGSGMVTRDDTTVVFGGASLVWTPWDNSRLLHISAGSAGLHFSINAETLANAVGRNLESSELRILADRELIAPLHDNSEAMTDAEHACTVIVREINQLHRGSGILIEAQIRAILVLLWRYCGSPRGYEEKGTKSSRVLQHFRQLLEAHFREKWTVTRYALAIGITPDRLHDICTRNLGRTPKQLVQERVVFEARQMLETSTLSTEEIAGHLGFRDQGHFSRFFKLKAGLPPATYRKSRLNRSKGEEPTDDLGYADWP